jgi:hypothetical protein
LNLKRILLFALFGSLLGFNSKAQEECELSFIYQEIFDVHIVLLRFKEINSNQCNDSLFISGPAEIPIPQDVEFGDVDLFRESVGVPIPRFRLKILKMRKKKCKLSATFIKQSWLPPCMHVKHLTYCCVLKKKDNQWFIKKSRIGSWGYTALML